MKRILDFTGWKTELFESMKSSRESRRKALEKEFFKRIPEDLHDEYKKAEAFYVSQLGSLPGITKEEAVYHIKNKFGADTAKTWSKYSTRFDKLKESIDMESLIAGAKRIKRGPDYGNLFVNDAKSEVLWSGGDGDSEENGCSSHEEILKLLKVKGVKKVYNESECTDRKSVV